MVRTGISIRGRAGALSVLAFSTEDRFGKSEDLRWVGCFRLKRPIRSAGMSGTAPGLVAAQDIRGRLSPIRRSALCNRDTPLQLARARGISLLECLLVWIVVDEL